MVTIRPRPCHPGNPLASSAEVTQALVSAAPMWPPAARSSASTGVKIFRSGVLRRTDVSSAAAYPSRRHVGRGSIVLLDGTSGATTFLHGTLFPDSGSTTDPLTPIRQSESARYPEPARDADLTEESTMRGGMQRIRSRYKVVQRKVDRGGTASARCSSMRPVGCTATTFSTHRAPSTGRTYLTRSAPVCSTGNASPKQVRTNSQARSMKSTVLMGFVVRLGATATKTKNAKYP